MCGGGRVPYADGLDSTYVMRGEGGFLHEGDIIIGWRRRRKGKQSQPHLPSWAMNLRRRTSSRELSGYSIAKQAPQASTEEAQQPA